jgi:hypothetical protein
MRFADPRILEDRRGRKKEGKEAVKQLQTARVGVTGKRIGRAQKAAATRPEISVSSLGKEELEA